MPLLPQNKRDQIMVLVTMLALGAAGAYTYLAWSPKQDELTTLAARLDTLTEANNKARVQVNRGTVARLRVQADNFQKDLDAMRRLVPTGNEVPMLLEQVSTAARRAGLDISQVEPEGVLPGERFDVYKYKIGLQGQYHAVAQFLANVGSLERIVAPINLSLQLSSRNGGNQPRGLNAKPKTEQTLDVKFEVQTYVVHPLALAPVQQAGAPVAGTATSSAAAAVAPSTAAPSGDR